MIRSMTAFARHERETPWGTLTWELRSVNHRYLEVYPRLPDDLRALETPVRERVTAALGRGKLECQLRFRSVEAATAGFSLDRDLIAGLVAATGEVTAVLPAAAAVNPLDVLRWPGVVRAAPLDYEGIAEAAMAGLNLALAELVDTREREGAKLRALIEQRCDAIETQVSAVTQRVPEVLARQREKLVARLAEVRAELDPSRLELEMVLFSQRLDVGEEVDRLAAHIGEVRRVLKQKEPVGRRLDFLMQELNREANTLGSKSADVETTRASVELKVLIEQMREQVQNIE